MPFQANPSHQGPGMMLSPYEYGYPYSLQHPQHFQHLQAQQQQQKDYTSLPSLPANPPARGPQLSYLPLRSSSPISTIVSEREIIQRFFESQLRGEDAETCDKIRHIARIVKDQGWTMLLYSIYVSR